MTTAPQHRTRNRRRAAGRRGGVYVLVLGVAAMITVVGLSAVALSRTQMRSTLAESEWARAGTLAQAGVEAAVANMNTSSTWRTDYAAGAEVSIGALGGSGPGGAGAASFRIIDPADGNLAKFDRDSVRVYGYGRVGGATRVFSLDCQYRPPPVLDVLKYAVYAGSSITCVNPTSVSGAPLGTPSLSNKSTLLANVRVGSLTNTGTIIGEVRTGAAGATSLSDAGRSSIVAGAVDINYSSLPSGGEISDTLLSATYNPYGSTSSRGIYRISVPLGSRLRIRNCRIAATLIVDLGLLSQLEVRDAVYWDRPSGDLPTLVLTTAATSSVTISGTSATLDEASVGMNLNPTGTPYEGVEDADKTDSYPSQIRGVIHIAGALSSIEIGPTVTIVGTLISESSLSFATGVDIRYDPQVLQSPPAAYQTGTAGMDPVAGTWKWQVLP